LIRFYTLPPNGIEHEYICVNPRSINQLYKRQFSHAICDSGVHYFYDNPLADDYPPQYLEDYTELSKRLFNNFGKKIWIIIPDYPDDYHPGQFGNNVKKTLANITRFIDAEDLPWVPTIQAKFKDIKSFVYCCKEIRKIDHFNTVAIGTICKVRNKKFIIKCCKIARRYFPDSWIHAFGPPLNAINQIKHYINSFDSTAWTFPRKSHKPSCKTASERRKYFSDYLSRLSEHLEQPNMKLTDFMSQYPRASMT
jgi:hypothetical protein